VADIKFKEQQKEMAIKAAVGAAAILLGFMFIVKPFFEETRALKLKIDVSKERLKLFDETELVRAKLEKLEGFFLTVPERSVVLGKISDIVSKEKLDIDTITPKTEPGEIYLKLFVDVSARGSFFQLVKFLKNVDTFNPAIKINAVTISRPPMLLKGKKEGKLQTSVSLETYLKQRAKKSNVR